jgi:hypothetical protein
MERTMNSVNLMKLFLVFAFVFIVSDKNLILGQQVEMDKEQPKVLKAISPTFIPFVFGETGMAEVVVEVTLNSEGEVISAKTVSFSLFKDFSLEETAKQWVFEKSKGKEIRTAKIKFILRIMPKGTSPSDLTTIYRYPSEIEIRNVVYDSQITTAPLPDTEKPRTKRCKPHHL